MSCLTRRCSRPASPAAERRLEDVPESDWKLFRELREVALQRFCSRILDELLSLIRGDPGNPHERYLGVFRRIQERDEQLAHGFNDPRRSRMVIQLAAIHTLGLLSPGELDRFSRETRGVVESLAKESAQ